GVFDVDDEVIGIDLTDGADFFVAPARNTWSSMDTRKPCMVMGGNMAQPRSVSVLAFDFRTRESVRPNVRLRA
ncbi:MAG TPA: hypothetical protein VGO00_04085, partial [Kofleriaceae bacterium]|nr:hypothetical protein [Kofleriaceae bacterium]